MFRKKRNASLVGFRHFLAISTIAIVSGCSVDNAGEWEVASQETYTAKQFFHTTNYRMSGAGPYAYSSTNGDLLITSDQTGVYNTYRMDTDTGELVALTESEEKGAYAESWFPNDDRFIYQQDGNGDELTHVFVKSSDHGVVDLTPGEVHKAGFFGWASDGASFFIFTNERDRTAFDIYEYQVADYSRSMIYENRQGLDLGAISGDGRWVVCVRNNSNADTDLILIDLSAEEPELINITPHKGNVEHLAIGFAPDDRNLIYLSIRFKFLN